MTARETARNRNKNRLEFGAEAVGRRLVLNDGREREKEAGCREILVVEILKKGVIQSLEGSKGGVLNRLLKRADVCERY